MVHFGEFLKTWSWRSNSVTRQVTFNMTKIGGKCQNQSFKCEILSNFQTMWRKRDSSTWVVIRWFPWASNEQAMSKQRSINEQGTSNQGAAKEQPMSKQRASKEHATSTQGKISNFLVAPSYNTYNYPKGQKPANSAAHSTYVPEARWRIWFRFINMRNTHLSEY